MFTTEFWKFTAERAVKTFAQSLIASIGVSATAPVWQLGWGEIIGIALTATLLSMLTSVASVGAATPGTPSLIKREDGTDSEGLVAGAQAADLAATPVANPHDPQPASTGGSHRVDH